VTTPRSNGQVGVPSLAGPAWLAHVGSARVAAWAGAMGWVERVALCHAHRLELEGRLRRWRARVHTSGVSAAPRPGNRAPAPARRGAADRPRRACDRARDHARATDQALGIRVVAPGLAMADLTHANPRGCNGDARARRHRSSWAKPGARRRRSGRRGGSRPSRHVALRTRLAWARAEITATATVTSQRADLLVPWSRRPRLREPRWSSHGRRVVARRSRHPQRWWAVDGYARCRFWCLSRA
jgi:hypothetical protein